jgi:Tfp pilus assembly protein PilX
MSPNQQSSRASVLPVVLSLVAILTLLIVSVLGTVLFDGRMSSNALENSRA